MGEETHGLLRKYVERLRSFKELLPQWTEVEVKKFLIEPLLAALGWDTTNPYFVRHEYPVTIGSEIKKADYVLMSDNKPLCVVEAKKENWMKTMLSKR
jgi:hypothetical protein